MEELLSLYAAAFDGLNPWTHGSCVLLGPALILGAFIISLINLKSAVAQSDAWRSTVLAQVGGANLKVMRMDDAPYPEECHSYPEGLLVIDGQLNLTVGSDAITVRAGEVFIVPVGVAHAVAPGSTGTLVIFDL